VGGTQRGPRGLDRNDVDGKPSLTIKNLPAALLQRIRRRAAANRRSLNLEVIASLESTVGSTLIDPETLLARARAVRIDLERDGRQRVRSVS